MACLNLGDSPTDFGFTGQRSDSDFGLVDYNARFYSPRLGRFVSPDSIVPDATEAQAFNRYAYANGNPLKFIDPTGHCAAKSSLGEEPDPDWNDGECWGLVYTIENMWNDTTYWNRAWGSREVFMNYIAATERNDAAYMQEILNAFFNSD